MTSSDQKMHDEELDEFLAGRDALSRQLAALPQPASPKRVDDAVMAAITARLAQEQAAKSVRQDVGLVQDVESAQGIAPVSAEITQVAPRRTTAANMGRWRAPAALAASLVGALLLTLEWQRGDYAQPAPAPAVAPEPIRAAATPQPRPAPQPKPALAAEERAPQSAQPAMPTAPAPAAAKSRPSAPAHPVLQAPSVAKPAIPALTESADIAMPPQTEALAINRRSSVAAPTVALPAPAPAPSAPPAPAPAPPVPPPAPSAALSFTARATSVPPAQIIAPAPPAPPAPTVVTVTGSARKAAPAADNARATEWLNVIDEMLKAGLRKDAIDEWRKFRGAYPDYPVPEELARQIAAID